MKKSPVLFFTLFLLVIILFLPLLLNLQQIYIQYTHWNNISNFPETIEITISKDVFNKSVINSKKEIILDNHLYDIVSYSVDKNVVHLKLYYDKDEENVLGKMKKILSLLKKGDVSSLVFLFYYRQNTFSEFFMQRSEIKFFVWDKCSYLSVFLEQLTPPPKCLSL